VALIAVFGLPAENYLDRTAAALLGGLAALIVARNQRWRRAAAWGLALLLAGEMLSYINSMRPRRLPARTSLSAAIPALPLIRSEFRTLSLGTRLPVEWGAWYGIRQADGFRESELPWYREYFVRAFGSPGERQGLSFAWSADQFRVDLDRASYLGVRFFVVDTGAPAMMQATRHLRTIGLQPVVSASGVEIYENRAARSRVQVMRTLRKGTIPAGESRLATVAFSDDPTLLSDAERLGIATHSADIAMEEQAPVIDIVEDHHDRLTVQVALPTPMVLSVADAWHPGLRSTCDGAPCHVGRLNGAFRGVAVPAGSHRITIRYVPFGFPATVWLSAIAMLILAMAAAMGRVSRRRAPSGDDRVRHSQDERPDHGNAGQRADQTVRKPISR
jgi:hypothetical protein